jgi:hypothetical protein
MKKFYMVAFASSLVLHGFAQQKKEVVYRQQQQTIVDLGNYSGPLAKPGKIQAFNKNQAEIIPLGTSANVYSTLLSNQNQIAYDPATGALAFIHRQNGTPSGTLVYDVSLNGGETWAVDQGPLTPEFEAGNAPQAGSGSRYPSCSIWNPDGNTDPAQAYIVGHGPALSDQTSAQWGNIFEVSSRLDGSDVAENYVDLTGTLTSFHPYSAVTANGHVWSLSTTYNTSSDGTLDLINYDTFYLNRADFDEGTNSFTWNVVDTWSPDFLEYDITDNGNPDNFVSSWGVNFGPDGQTGYAIIVGAEVSAVGLDTVPKPLLWKTIDGGETWNRLPEFDFSTIQLFQDILAIPDGDDTVRPYFSDFDIAVDADGNLHIFCEMLSGFGGQLENLGSIFADLTTQYLVHGWTSDGTDWQFNEVSPIINNGDGVIGAVGIFLRLQASRSSDGSMIFMTWNEDNDQEAISFPDIMARAFNVANQDYSEIINLTEGSDAEEFAFWQTIAPVSIDNGECFEYELPIVFSEPGASDTEPLQFYYLRGVGFNYPYVGVEENKLDMLIDVYPNPAQDSFSIRSPYNWNMNVELFDQCGKRVFSENFSHGITRVNVSNLAPGMYYAEISNGEQRVSKKIVVE